MATLKISVKNSHIVTWTFSKEIFQGIFGGRTHCAWTLPILMILLSFPFSKILCSCGVVFFVKMKWKFFQANLTLHFLMSNQTKQLVVWKTLHHSASARSSGRHRIAWLGPRVLPWEAATRGRRPGLGDDGCHRQVPVSGGVPCRRFNVTLSVSLSASSPSPLREGCWL